MKPFLNLKLLVALLTLTGCAQMKVSRTVALPGLPPVSNAKQVAVVEHLEDVKQPYQLVGKVTVTKFGSRLDKSKSTALICEQAARMGADGVIGLHTSSRGWHYSGLTVKWLESETNAQPVAKPFVIAALPVVPNPKAPGRHEKLARQMRDDLFDLTLETKGYYVLPGWVAEVTGGLEQAKQMDAAAFNALGGSQAQLLQELTFVEPPSFHHYVLFATTHAKLQMTLLDKRTQTTAMQASAVGGENTFIYFIVGGPIFSSLIPVFIIEPMRNDAALFAARSLAEQVPAIGEEVIP